MPFGKWPNFGACVVDMQGPPNNYDEETAKKTCGKLQGRLEGKQVFKILKAIGNRRVVAQYVHVEGLDLEKDIIPNHRVKEALEELKTRDPRYQNVMWKHSGYQIGHPLWSFRDADGELHKTEVDEYGLWGITEIRNDGYDMAEKIWSMIMAGLPMGASVGINPHGKAVILTKDEIQKRRLRKDWEGGRYWDVPLQFIEPWSLTASPANQYVTTVAVLSKDICEPCVEQRAKWYIDQGLETDLNKARLRARNFIICLNHLEKQQKAPTEEDRAKRHFKIDDATWNQLSDEAKQKYIDALPERGQQIEKQKPPKDWWDACMANVSGTDKAKVCGHIFHNVLGGDRAKADPSMFNKEMWKAIFKAMTWEECIAQAKKNPNVTNPEALCGWLKAHGPNAPKSLDLVHALRDEELFKKLWNES